ncbi:probable adenylate kinase 7, mitochondrial [Amaranthus tricolor]|uniref:probable adenylate kinase 7, mitochondrial n=1 Tax=Amaranthus tricolor TaxID=29722 RepID=UPI002589A925|nr:probable adenylate kinase 7, mitochondrial [Amaranthus tricolor]
MAGLGFVRARSSITHLSTVFKTRTFAAAALQYDVDYDDYGDFDDQRDTILYPMVDGEGLEPRRGVQWVIIGEPGAKKHVYAKKLSKLLQVPHISMASLLRHQLQPGSVIYKQIESIVSRGMLVPEDIIFGLLSKRLEAGYFRGETGFILEGIPRTRKQAEILDQIADIDLVLNLKCADCELVGKKLQSRSNLHLQGSKIEAFSEEVWKQKLHTYAEQSKPLEDYYKKQKRVVEFQVSEGLGETWKGLLSVLQLEHMDSSFQKLTA